MPEREPTPLASPRSPGDPAEIRYVREQADFYRTMRGTVFELTHVLIPACFLCASTRVHLLRSEDAYVCDDCGRQSAPGRAGRLALR